MEELEYWFYARKSTDREDNQIQSIEIQNDWREEIEKRLKIKVTRFFMDKKSARRPGKRPDFTRMMKELSRFKGNVAILTITVNRLARNMKEGGEIIDLLQIGKINPIITRDTFYYPETDTTVIASQFSAGTQYSKELSKNVRAGMDKAARERKKWMWQARLGYKNKMDPDTREKFVVPDDSFPIIVSGWKMALDGVPIPEIDQKMYDMGLRTKVTNKRPIPKRPARSVIHRIFESPFYAGFVFDQYGNLIEGVHEKAVSVKDFNSYQARQAKIFIRSEQFFPFRSIIKCGECGCSITSMVKKGYTYYNCTKKRGPCSQKYIREELLDEKFAEILSNHVLAQDFFNMAKDSIINDVEEKRELARKNNEGIAKKLDELDAERINLIRMAGKGQIDPEGLKKAEQAINQEEIILKGKQQGNRNFTSKEINVAKSWLELLESLSASYKLQHYKEKAYLLQKFGLNYVLKDGNLACVSVNPIFDTPPKTSEILIGGPNETALEQIKTAINEFVNRIFENIEEIELILTRLDRNPCC